MIFENKQIIIMSGFPGSGKSTLAKKIAKKLKFQYLSSDIIRKELFNSSRFDKRGHQFINSIIHKVYVELYNRAIDLVQKNKKVIIDGTHLHVSKREIALKKILSKVEAKKIIIITVKTPKNIIEKRMKKYNKKTSNKENIFQGWQRVFAEFKQDQKKGLVSWPDNNLGIDIIDSKDIYEQLDK